jgi:hypothetical protein
MNTDVRYKNIRKGITKIVGFVILLVILMTPIVSVLAQGPGSASGPTGEPSASGPTSGGKFTLQNPLKVKSLGGLIEAFVEVFSYLVILFAVLALVYVGLQYILARGNPERMKELSNWLLWIVVGVAVVIGARILVSVVINTLGASGVVDPKVIQSANNAIDGK